MNEPEPEPDPELVTLPFPKPDRTDAQIAEYLSEPAADSAVEVEPGDVELGVFYDGSEDLEEEEDAADHFYDDEEELDEETRGYMAELTPELMEKMYANMRAHGIIV